MSTPDTEHVEFTPALAVKVSALVPFGDHKPEWDTADCPSCGSAPCGPHPTVLFCAHCGDPYPCGPVRETAAELVRLGNIRDHVARVARVGLEMRAAELLLAPSSEDTPPHTHTDACMCEMYDLDVIGARECTHCGGYTGGPCGSRCAVAYDEIVKGATPPRVWQEGDEASWRGYHVKVVAAPPSVAIALTARGDVIAADADELSEVPTPGGAT